MRAYIGLRQDGHGQVKATVPQLTREDANIFVGKEGNLGVYEVEIPSGGFIEGFGDVE